MRNGSLMIWDATSGREKQILTIPGGAGPAWAWHIAPTAVAWLPPLGIGVTRRNRVL